MECAETARHVEMCRAGSGSQGLHMKRFCPMHNDIRHPLSSLLADGKTYCAKKGRCTKPEYCEATCPGKSVLGCWFGWHANCMPCAAMCVAGLPARSPPSRPYGRHML